MKALRNFAIGFALVATTTFFAYAGYWTLATIPATIGWVSVALGAIGFAGIVISMFFCWGIGSEVWREGTAEDQSTGSDEVHL